MKAIMMTKEFWFNSQLSIARFYGGISLNGEQYLIVGDQGDLVKATFCGLYRKLGREKFMEILQANQRLGDKQVRKLMTDALKESKKPKVEEQNLFDNGQNHS